MAMNAFYESCCNGRGHEKNRMETLGLEVSGGFIRLARLAGDLHYLKGYVGLINVIGNSHFCFDGELGNVIPGFKMYLLFWIWCQCPIIYIFFDLIFS